VTLLCLLATAASPALSPTPPASAAGFLVYEMSAEAMGKGSAVSASTREPAAVWFNPAALTEQGHGVSLGGTAVLATTRFEPVGGGDEQESEFGKHFLPTFFGTAKVHEQVALAMGIFPAFAIGIEWPGDWIGNRHTIKAQLETVNFNPTVAVRLLPQLSLGAGFQAVRGGVELITGLPAKIGGTARLGGGDWGFGGNVGLLYQPLPDQLGLALAYRSRVKMEFDGRVDFDPRETDFSPTLVDQGGGADITLPDILTFGVMGRVTPALTLTFDANYTLWSTYDELVIDFEREPPERDQVLRRDNKDSFTLRLGADWATPAEGLAVRAGVIYDQNPSPADTLSPSLPDADRLDFGLGLGYRTGWFKGDLGYLLVYFLPSDAEGGVEGPEGTYRSLAHLIGLTLTAQFH
jgi:long-chain fatty acid transport protein